MLICFLVCRNLYDSKKHFTQEFAKALNRYNVETHILEWTSGPVPQELLSQVKDIQPDLTCSFNQPSPDENGLFFWDHLKIPHWTIAVDPIFYDLELTRSPFSIISCVDRGDVKSLHSLNFERSFFFPHAIEKELAKDDNFERIFDIVLLGSSYDPEGLRKHWQGKYPKQISAILDTASEITLASDTPFISALTQALIMDGLSPSEVDFRTLAFYVDSYTRGLDRLELIRSIKDVPVHVFGTKCWRDDHPVKDWSECLSGQPNVKTYPSVSFTDSFKILKRSKLCLNSMPFFKDGTHERIFVGLGCGALPITTDGIFIREEFIDTKELILYRFKDLKSLNDKVNHYLSNDMQRQEIIDRGKQKVLAHYTWDARVEQAITILKNWIT